ncbi:MAG: putative serine/threonine protein kinase, partial [Streblomastix strix]
GISILLIYSLLMISVDTRTFEVGILRMFVLDRFGVVGVLIAQALLYSIPGWILGIILGFVCNFVVMYILEDSSSIPLQKLISALIIIISTLIAFGISLIASLLPINQALSKNLHDSIDVTHTKASAIIVTIERTEALQTLWGWLLCDIILTTAFLFSEERAVKSLAVQNNDIHRITKSRNTKIKYMRSAGIYTHAIYHQVVGVMLSIHEVVNHKQVKMEKEKEKEHIKEYVPKQLVD